MFKCINNLITFVNIGKHAHTEALLDELVHKLLIVLLLLIIPTYCPSFICDHVWISVGLAGIERLILLVFLIIFNRFIYLMVFHYYKIIKDKIL